MSKPKVEAIMSTMGDPFFEFSKQSLLDQTYPIEKITVVEGVTPLRKALNTAVDIARKSTADFVIHMDDDMLLYPFTIQSLIEHIDSIPCWAFACHCEDAILGRILAGFRIYRTEHIGDFHFGQGPTADRDAYEKQAEKTGLPFLRTSLMGAFHHPIWRAKDLYMKLRFSMPKYPKSWIPWAYRVFFMRELNRTPWNKVLNMGYELTRLMVKDLDKWVLNDKDPKRLNNDWEEYRTKFNKEFNRDLKDWDWWALMGFEPIAEEIYGKQEREKETWLELLKTYKE